MMAQRRDVPVDAPAFNPARNDYPLSGAKTGPAWRAAWALLRDSELAKPGEYVAALPLIEGVQQYEPQAHTETVRNLLYAAVRAGVLESETRLVDKRNRTHFRIKR